jgi:hypothetical protein
MFGKETGGSRQGLVFSIWDYPTIVWETERKYSNPRRDSGLRNTQLTATVVFSHSCRRHFN